MSPWSNMVYLEIRRKQIEPEQPDIPSEDSKALESLGNRRDKEHGSWRSSYVQGSRRAVWHFIESLKRKEWNHAAVKKEGENVHNESDLCLHVEA